MRTYERIDVERIKMSYVKDAALLPVGHAPPMLAIRAPHISDMGIATVVPLAAGYLTAAISRLLGKDASGPKLCVACGGHPPRKTNATLPSTLFVAGKLFLVEIYA